MANEQPTEGVALDAAADSLYGENAAGGNAHSFSGFSSADQKFEYGEDKFAGEKYFDEETQNFWLRDFGLNTHHNTWLDFLTDRTILVAFGVIAFTAVLLPYLVMFAYRFWRRKQNEKAGYVTVDPNQVGHFNSDLLDSLTAMNKEKKKEKKHPKKSKKGHMIVPNDSDAESEQSTSISSPVSSPETKKSSVKFEKFDTLEEQSGKMAKQFQKFSEEKEKLEKSEKYSNPINATRFNNNFDFKELKDDEVEELSHMEFHGKLATAKLRAKATKLEEQMTEDEKKEEARLKAEQLEKIFAMMAADQDKFGLANKSDLMDQMKMYSI